MTVTFTFKGGEDVARRFAALSKQAREKVAWPAAVDAMEWVEATAKEKAFAVDDPSTPNFIPANIGLARRKKLGDAINAAVVSVGMKRGRKGSEGGNTYYWWWTAELGTRTQRARPFLRPSLDENKDRILQEFIGSARYQLIKLGESV